MASIFMTLLGDIRYDGRVRKEIQTLTRAGHEVALVVSDFKGMRSGGEDLGISIAYVPVARGSNPAMNFLEQMRFNREAAALIGKSAPTHIHCHDLSSLAAGVWAKRKTGARLIFDAHELMPESMGGFREAVWNRIEAHCIKSCDCIIMPEKNRITYFKTKYSQIPPMLLLENFPCRSEIPDVGYNLFRKLYPISERQKIILYTGVIDRKRHAEELIDSMALCDHGFVLVMLGESYKGYGDAMREKVAKLGLGKRVFFHDPVPQVDILRYMASADIGTAFYRNTNLNNYYCASNKVYEYIALEKPLVTNSYPGLIESVENFRQGVCVDEISPESLAAAFTKASDVDLVRPGAKKFFWEDGHSTLAEIYDHSIELSPLRGAFAANLCSTKLLKS